MEPFRDDNTAGYTPLQREELNREWALAAAGLVGGRVLQDLAELGAGNTKSSILAGRYP